MGWKEWPYWIKGGIILGFLDLAFLILRVSSFINNRYDDSAVFGWVFTNLPLSWVYLRLFGITSPINNYEIVFLFIVGILNWFIIGAIIGFIIGKIKSK